MTIEPVPLTISVTLTYWDWRTEDFEIQLGDGNLSDWMSALDPAEVMCATVEGVDIWSANFRPAGA